jgi:putative FmdB family regulatory protein
MKKKQILNVFQDLGDKIKFMPLFEFMCKKCNKKFEILVFDKEKVECPECKNNKVVKQFSGFVALSSSSNCISTNVCSAVRKEKNKCCRSSLCNH